jgi:hypothetical protein
VGTGTFQSNSPVGVGSVHDIHASNIDINARARTEMSSNPFMWMFNMPNQQDFWKDFVVVFAVHDTLVDTEVVVFEIKVADVASELGITVDSEKSQEVQYQSVSDHLSCDKQNNSSPRCRLPLDGVVLNALHSVNKEFVNKGTLRTFKASSLICKIRLHFTELTAIRAVTSDIALKT